MQTPAAGSKPTNVLTQLAMEVEKVDRSSATPAIIHQLYLSLRWLKCPQGLLTNQGINPKYSPAKAWKELGLFEKMSALYRTLGFTNCFRSIPSLRGASQAETGTKIAELEQFKGRVSAISDGVVTARQVNSYMILRTQLLAITERLLGVAKARAATLASLDFSGNKHQTPLSESFTSAHASLNAFFAIIDQLVINDNDAC
ncbi:MAG: hypothetical protein LLG04_17205, partial [Parachlamydia sp.]|nr:hypothetical protein [Parachlamydia sp.]